MITTKSWAFIGTFALAMAESAYSSTFTEKDFKGSTDELFLSGKDLLAATLIDFPLESLPTDRRYFPILEKVYCMGNVPAPGLSPTEEQKQGGRIAACEKATDLTITRSSGSLTTIEWIKLFFPNLKRLQINIEGLPIQSGAPSISPEQLKAAEMESVTELVISAVGRTKRMYPPLAENLRLFPKLKLLDLSFGTESLGGMLDVMLLKNTPLPPIECLRIDNAPLDYDLFVSAMGRLPSLTELAVSGETFSAMIQTFYPIDPDLSPFNRLTKLRVNCSFSVVDFSKKMACVFPRVSEIEIRCLPLDSLLSAPSKGSKFRGITKVTAYGSGKHYPPSFFKSLFPGMDSLTIAGGELTTLFSKDSSQDKAFLADLKHLDISSNWKLHCKPNRIGDQLRAFHSRLRNDPSLAPPELPQGASPIEHEPLAPLLESLDIRNSISSSDAKCLFRDVPNITKLRISNYFLEEPTEEELQGSFSLLTRLKDLDVEMRTDRRLPSEKTMRNIRQKLESASMSHLTVQFFTKYSSTPINESECLEEEPMEE